MPTFSTKLKNIIKRVKKNVYIRIEQQKVIDITCNSKQITILNTALDTDNLGDEIIMKYIKQVILDDLKEYVCIEIPTHKYPSTYEIRCMLESKYVLVCGTNILSPQMELYSGWCFDDLMIHLNNVILIGVGWWGYKKTSIYSAFIYRHILTNNCLHSVRDAQTLHRLKSLGIENVVDTNCLTMWGLEQKSLQIPKCKSNCVLFTLTSAFKDSNNDIKIVNILLRNYNNVYFWPQGNDDLPYFTSIIGEPIKNIKILDRTLDAYCDFLKSNNCDYIGSRLHGGIYAMQNYKRTIIIAVDNRAREIAKDTNMNVLEINEIETKLEALINSEWSTEIHLNNKSIEQWKQAFSNVMLTNDM